jgi:hypothetical protein
MVIDTAAIIAVLVNESNAAGIAQVIETGFEPSVRGKSAGGIDCDREPKG